MGAVFTNACCCKDGNMRLSNKGDGAKDCPAVPGHAGQHRAMLQIKSGGFSIGAFAASNRGKLEDFYMLEKSVLGEGSYGSVQRCQFKDTGQWRAVKSINKALLKNPAQFQEEMAIMKVLDHPNIVRLYETFEDSRLVYLVLELCKGGELFDRIVADGKFNEQAAARCVQQMLLAVNYMHQNRIMHRDLKPENWLLAEDGAILETELKLIDFGLAKRFQPGDVASTKAGTPYYVAPEVLDGRYAEKSDVWSIGVIMFILLCGAPPFSGNDTVAVLDSVRRARLDFDQQEEWTHITRDAKEMLKAMLQRNPASRPSAADMLQNAWLSNQTQAPGDHSDITATVLPSLRTFGLMNKLKKASLNVIATQLNDAQLRQLKALFMAMDKNNDGTLCIPEIKNCLERAGVSLPEDLNAMIREVDTDGSGVIDYTEFIAATMDKRKYMEEDVCWRAFKFFDVDGSGMLDREEVLRLMSMPDITDVMQVRVTQHEVDEIMEEVDLNSDGLIDFDEFIVMMRRMPTATKSGNPD